MFFRIIALARVGNLLQKVLQRRPYSSKNDLLLENISPFGSIVVNCPHIETIIQPINPFDVPDGNQACFSIFHSCEKLLHEEYFHVDYDKKQSIISLQQKDFLKTHNNHLTLAIQIPHNYNINVNALAVDLKETEGDNLVISSNGDCTLGKIKTDHVNINIYNGKLSCESLLGSGQIFAEKGVEFLKIQSKHLDVESACHIELSSVYSPQLRCFTENGNIKLGSVHGHSDLRTHSGCVSISALDGDANIQTISGDVSTTIESCKNVFVTSEQGNISVGLSEAVTAFVEAEGTFVDVPQDLLVDGMKRESSDGVHYFEGRLGTAENAIQVKTRFGTICFSKRNWFSKFNIDLS